MIGELLAKGGMAVAITLAVQWLLMPVAYRLNLLDFPAGRKDHARPTPITGGLAMSIGVLVASWFTLEQMNLQFLAFCLGAGLLIGVGLLDDRFDLPWQVRICAQVAAATIMATMGEVRVEHLGSVFGLGDISLGPLSAPFTVFATVGLINAINMIDGADGLAGSLVLIALLMLVGVSLSADNTVLAQRMAIMVGAVAAFLWFNLRFPWRPQASVFMGNAGSAFLGFVIAWACFRLTQNPRYPVSPVLALWLIPVPVIDTLALMMRRLRQGRSPFLADHGHIHHLFRQAGLRPMQKVMILCAFSLGCGLAAMLALRLNVPEPLLLAVFVALCVGWYWLGLDRARVVRLISRLGGHACPPEEASVPMASPVQGSANEASRGKTG